MLPTSACHPEQVRNVVVMATMETFSARVEVSVVEVRSTEHQKPPQAGSHKSLMYLAESEELFYHKECKFAYVEVDQTSRRSLLIPLRGCYAPLGFLRSAKPHYENFDAPHTRLAQDDSAACSFAAQNFGGLLVNHSSRMPESVPSRKQHQKPPIPPFFSLTNRLVCSIL